MNPVLTISGTSRPNNFTSRALAVVEDELERRGHPPVRIDGRELDLGFPGSAPTDDALRLREAIADASAVVLATPEYHGSFAAFTKLVIENLGFPSALKGKPIALVGVAAGRIGAIKSLEQLRGVCAHVGALVLPGAVSIAGVKSAFDDEGRVVDPGADATLRGVAESVLGFLETYVRPARALEAAVRDDGKVWTSAV